MTYQDQDPRELRTLRGDFEDALLKIRDCKDAIALIIEGSEQPDEIEPILASLQDVSSDCVAHIIAIDDAIAASPEAVRERAAEQPRPSWE